MSSIYIYIVYCILFDACDLLYVCKNYCPQYISLNSTMCEITFAIKCFYNKMSIISCLLQMFVYYTIKCIHFTFKTYEKH